jgi:plasmid stabilization system protein ParE
VRVVVAPEAQVDIAEAYNSVAEDNSQAADRLLARVVEIIGLLAAKEFVGREVVLRDGRRVRTWPIPPYRVYYRERADVFEVVRVYHQSRRPIERQPRSRPKRRASLAASLRVTGRGGPPRRANCSSRRTR